jgi:hypothetical protein
MDVFSTKFKTLMDLLMDVYIVASKDIGINIEKNENL